MSTTPVDYKQATQVVFVAIAIGAVPPTCLIPVLGPLALAALGIYGLELLLSEKKDDQQAQHKRLYCIAPRLLDRKNQREVDEQIGESVERAFERVKKFKSFNWYTKTMKINAQQALLYFKTKAKEGTCYGSAAFLLSAESGEKRTHYSLEENVARMQLDEIVFRQTISFLRMK